MTQYLLIDGQFYVAEEAQVPAHLLGHLLFAEEIRAVRNELPFWEKHLELFALKLNLLNQPVPAFLQYEGKELKRQIERMLVKNKYFKSAFISFYLFRAAEKFSYILKCRASQSVGYELNKNGLSLAVSDKIIKGVSSLSAIDWGSEPFWKLARQAGQSGFDELVLVNPQNSLLETPGKNIYFLKGDTVFSPSPEAGAYTDVSQSAVRQVCEKLKLNFQFKEDLKEGFLLAADEVFLASSLYGIEWVKSYQNKRYHYKTVRLIQENFNQLLI